MKSQADAEGEESPCPNLKPPYPVSLQLDLEKYLPELDQFDITDAQKVELLKTLWNIMRGFVEMGYGIDALHHHLPALVASSAGQPIRENGGT